MYTAPDNRSRAAFGFYLRSFSPFASSFVPPPKFGCSMSSYVALISLRFYYLTTSRECYRLFCFVLFCYLFIPLHYISVNFNLIHDCAIPLFDYNFKYFFPYCTRHNYKSVYV